MDWAKLIAGPLVKKWANEQREMNRICCVTPAYGAWEQCADELLAHLRESGIGELLEAGQAMRDCNYINTKNSMDWDAAKAKLLGKVPGSATPELSDKDGWVYDPDEELRKIRARMAPPAESATPAPELSEGGK